MSRYWKLRIALARLILGSGPKGHDYCFRGKTLYIRSRSASRESNAAQ